MDDALELKLDLAELSQWEELVFEKLSYSYFYLIRMIGIL